MYLFHIKENAIALIGLKLNIKTVDLTTKAGFSWLRENMMSDTVEIFDAEKQIKEDKKIQIFELIEKGAQITKGELFKYFEQLIG
jgi:5-bromo-4-chloroindolyl phosphate hydrolysis protein